MRKMGGARKRTSHAPHTRTRGTSVVRNIFLPLLRDAWQYLPNFDTNFVFTPFVPGVSLLRPVASFRGLGGRGVDRLFNTRSGGDFGSLELV